MATPENHLIELLPRKDRQHFLAACERVELVLGTVLCKPGEPTRYVYFPVNGFISLLTLIDGEPALEVGMVGREGMVGAQLSLGIVNTLLHPLVQGDGAAWRLSTAAFKRELKHSTALQGIMSRYVYVLMAQLAESAACLRFHEISPRLARWLLMTQDRAHSNKFQVTQQFLAYMLGVRRVGITAAASVLQRRGLIEYRRGELTVLDRNGLEATACGCYAADRRAYAELLA